MKKKDLIKTISEDSNITLSQAKDAYHSILFTIANELAEKGEFNIVGFGEFTVTTLTSKGKISKEVTFKAGKQLLETIK